MPSPSQPPSRAPSLSRCLALHSGHVVASTTYLQHASSRPASTTSTHLQPSRPSYLVFLGLAKGHYLRAARGTATRTCDHAIAGVVANVPHGHPTPVRHNATSVKPAAARRVARRASARPPAPWPPAPPTSREPDIQPRQRTCFFFFFVFCCCSKETGRTKSSLISLPAVDGGGTRVFRAAGVRGLLQALRAQRRRAPRRARRPHGRCADLFAQK